MAGIGLTELLIVLVVVLVIFGAGKVPEVMRSLGSSVREMKEIASDVEGLSDDFPTGYERDDPRRGV